MSRVRPAASVQTFWKGTEGDVLARRLCVGLVDMCDGVTLALSIGEECHLQRRYRTQSRCAQGDQYGAVVQSSEFQRDQESSQAESMHKGRYLHHLAYLHCAGCRERQNEDWSACVDANHGS